MSGAFDEIIRLVIAAAVGVAIGFNRELGRKPLGVRTLALVSLGSAVAALAAVRFHDLEHAPPDALARVVQGILVGVLTGVGFIGAGTVMRNRNHVHGLTTAATVWVTAALGMACALADWTVVIAGTALALAILFGLGWIEGRLSTTEK